MGPDSSLLRPREAKPGPAPASEFERTPVLLVSQVCLYREGLLTMLERYPDLDIVGACADAASALSAQAEAARARVVLLDVVAAGSRDAIHLLRAELPDAAVVALAVPDREQDALELAEAGATGLVTLDASVDELVAAIRRASRGEAVCTPSLTAALMRRLASLARDRGSQDPQASLTLREREIVELMQQGLSNKQIAQRLQIQVPTVKNHVHHILAKLGVERRAEVVALARTRVAGSRQ